MKEKGGINKKLQKSVRSLCLFFPREKKNQQNEENGFVMGQSFNAGILLVFVAGHFRRIVMISIQVGESGGGRSSFDLDDSIYDKENDSFLFLSILCVCVIIT